MKKKKLAIEMYHEGIPTGEIAKILKVSEAWVVKVVGRY